MSIISISPSRCIVHTQLFSDCFKSYTFPSAASASEGIVGFAVNSFELSEAMSKSKGNHHSSITLTLENIEKPTHIDLDFFNDLGEKTIPSTLSDDYRKLPPSYGCQLARFFQGEHTDNQCTRTQEDFYESDRFFTLCGNYHGGRQGNLCRLPDRNGHGKHMSPITTVIQRNTRAIARKMFLLSALNIFQTETRSR